MYTQLNAVLLSLAIAILSLCIFTRSNDFPVEYHPDEQGKAKQIMADPQTRNFNQPLLLLEASNLARIVFHVPDNIRAVVIAGRWTSAALGALVVFSLALAASFGGGYWGVILTGAAMTLCPALLVYSHYMKEDTALVAGIAVAVLGARIVVGNKRIWRQLGGAVVLGVGCAAAASGKYVGLVVALPCFIAILLAPRWKLIPVRLIVFLFAAIAAVEIINARAFDSVFPPRLSAVALEHFQTEFAHGTTGHDYLALTTPNLYCIKVAASELLPHIWIFLFAGMIWIIVRREITRWGLALLAFLVVMIASLSFDTIPFERYALPITLLLYFCAAQLAVCILCSAKLAKISNVGLIVCFIAIVAIQGARCVNFTGQFADDSRQRLREWMAHNIPAGSEVAIDRYAVLNGPGDPDRFPNQAALQLDIIADNGWAADPFRFKNDIQYVVIIATNYERFFEPGAHGLAPKVDDFTRRRKFYGDLLAHGDLIWASIPSPPTHAYVNPELRVYRIESQ